jgi:outer membrane murein-binding lipoprotein Lpp
MLRISKHELEAILDRKLKPIYDALGVIQQEVDKMDAAGEALQHEIDQLDADVKADNEAVVAGGEAVAAAGTKFAELKALLEKQATGALSDEEATQLTTLAGEVDGHLTSASTELQAHVKTLNEEAAAA